MRGVTVGKNAVMIGDAGCEPIRTQGGGLLVPCQVCHEQIGRQAPPGIRHLKGEGPAVEAKAEDNAFPRGYGPCLSFPVELPAVCSPGFWGAQREEVVRPRNRT